MGTLADRMKAYEHEYRHTMPPRSYTLLRLDGRAFHSYTRGLERPFDKQFAADMDETARVLCAEITGCRFAYVQSDEMSFLLTDFATPTTQPWMGGVQAKILSLTAGLAAATFNRLRPDAGTALFDARIFTLPGPAEVANYFIWRQRDAIKNSISMAAGAAFSHRRLDGLNSTQRLALLRDEEGIDWGTYPTGFRQGRIIDRREFPETVTYTHGKTGEVNTKEVLASRWTVDDAPTFTHGPGWLSGAIPVRDSTP